MPPCRFYDVGGFMAWKQISEQDVVALLEGKVRQVRVTAWDSYSGAIHVEWPPVRPGAPTPNPRARMRQTTIDKAHYEPLDPDGFKVATTG
jgi:hypothetical protein